jgi:hypothetical protein
MSDSPGSASYPKKQRLFGQVPTPNPELLQNSTRFSGYSFSLAFDIGGQTLFSDGDLNKTGELFARAAILSAQANKLLEGADIQ